MNSELTPRVSVVIPTYNHGRYIRRALESVINQTWSCIEIIVVDNHSTDNTADVIKSIGDVRIKHFLINNQGVIAKSRNFGLSVACGNWIAFLDSDDWWQSDKLQRCLERDLKNVDLVYHALIIKKNWNSRWPEKRIRSWQVVKPVVKDLLLRGNAIANSSVIVRKQLIQSIGGVCEKSEMVGSEDYNTWLRIARVTDRFVYVNQALGFYLDHGLNISKRDILMASREAVGEYFYLLSAGEIKLVEARFRYAAGRFKYLNGDQLAARQDLRFSLRHGSLNIKFRSIIAFLLAWLRNQNRMS